ncbi:hypothetical protein [Actinoplanes sp. URMC 104]|uniref:hypothetical protein n=1 Tax=Actinoplanes sp. URMC 104 TaxID=3423409 RepID=UPI003F1B938A
MTTVVGLAGLTGLWMAADTMTHVYERPVSGASKIVRLPMAGGQHLLLGFDGSPGMPAIALRLWTDELKGDVELPPSVDLLPAFTALIASALTEAFREAGMTDMEMRLDGTMLLGVPGGEGLEPTLWTITHHTAIRHLDGRGAVGSGEGPAVGALDALLTLGVKPGDAVRQACEIGVSRDRSSGLPVLVETLTTVPDTNV